MNVFSVVISTYAGERSLYLDQALTSVIQQSVKPSEIVLVFDGVVPESQLAVAKKHVEANPGLFNIVQLDFSVGRGEARNVGVYNSKHSLVAIMDSDDVAYPYRFEEQLKVLETNDVDIVTGWQTEFINSPENIVATKKCPDTHNLVLVSLKFRCQIPNPTILFKRELFDKAGGYGDYKQINEDHDLFIKMAIEGAKFGIVHKPLINVRISAGQRKRRGIRVIRDDYNFRYSLYRRGYYNFSEFLWYFILIAAFRLMPIQIKNLIYTTTRSKTG